MIEHITLGDGCRIAFRLEGPAGAPILMLSNSLGASMEMWAPQMAALTPRFRVLRYDSRGHGRSDAPPGAYGMDRLGRDVIELLDALDISKVVFCGLSKGGMVGQWLGWRAPERLLGLVLANTSPFMGPPSDWDARITRVRQHGMAAIADAVLDRWFTPAFRNDAATDPVRVQFKMTDPDGYAGCCAAIRDMDMRPVLGLIRAPTLVIGGLHDPATPPTESEHLASQVQGASLEFLPCAHLSNIQCSEQFTLLLIYFMTQHTKGLRQAKCTSW